MMYFLKKGVVVSTVIIGLILALVGFGIVLWFLFESGVDDFGIDEVCKLSVLTRASVSNSVQGYVPLKCTTKKICLTRKLFGGKCEQFAGEDNVEVIRLNRDNKKAAELIEKVNAKAFYNCWKMMGEGKLDLFGDKEIWTSFVPASIENAFDYLNGKEVRPTCVFCARIALDKDFVYKKESNERFSSEFTDDFKDVSSKINMYNYFKTKKSPSNSGLTYLEEFTDKQIKGYPSNFKNKFNNKITDENLIFFMQLISNSNFINEKSLFDLEGANEVFVYTGIVVGTFLLTPVGSIVSLGGIIAAMTSSWTASGVLSAAEKNKETSLANLYCGKLTTGKKLSGGVYGCSMVKMEDYKNVKEINKVCKNIEGEL